MRKNCHAKVIAAEPDRQPTEEKYHERTRSPRVKGFRGIKGPIKLPGYLPAVFDKVGKNVGDILRPPGPAPLLFIDISHRFPECRRNVRVH